MYYGSNKKQRSRGVSSERYKQKRNIIRYNRAIIGGVMMVVLPITLLEVGMGVVYYIFYLDDFLGS
jgi:hypothetical protein